jgi:hypothetical protein
LKLTWGDVDWERGRFRVSSPKTEHHEGKEERWVPLFPELRPHLEAAFDAAEPGQVNVISWRDTDKNLRTRLTAIIRRAGLVPWPKLFINLRSSRETELAAVHPLHVVCAWIGNSTPIAAKHYLQITDMDFERATKSGAQSGSLAVQNPAKHGDAPARKSRHKLVPNARLCETVRNLATPTYTPGRTRTCDPLRVREVPSPLGHGSASSPGGI